MVGGIHAIDGPAAAVMDDAQLKDLLSLQALGSSQVSADPAECLDLLHSGSFSDDRIPTAAARVGSLANAAIITASADPSGLYWQGMYSLGRALAHCSPATLTTVQGDTARVELAPVAADLHGRKAIAIVQTLTTQNGAVHVLRMVAMDGNLFVTGSKAIPAAQPTDAAIKELGGYVNAVIDGAGKDTPETPAPTTGTKGSNVNA
ncbi:hypothetical protein [Arthrobacter bambusae]|uniref:PknH-like extracellular domain-containing protein n=1 Tax=Arthrobacter bambusae TaxID=1338426 RepID=A0AAW8DGL1_9MICC|nr:hypothetical protein [Arthrobacter bambusae]MDP9904606.1 hypothetical protein [Arthrobacter bambusae]MDQ0129422.1 hypothetical protein [Arthrobacter bambusae]MDQ0180965.1 hypothetical protein [Arthrobacter bambusae]